MIALILAAGALAAADGPNSVVCDRNAGNTPAIEACGALDMKSADGELARYVGAATAKLQKDAEWVSKAKKEGMIIPGSREAQTPEAFADAEVAWKAYRKAECDAQYDRWSGGSIAGSEWQQCSIALTRLHTHTIWEMWLTSPERGAAPLLPEPKGQATP